MKYVEILILDVERSLLKLSRSVSSYVMLDLNDVALTEFFFPIIFSLNMKLIKLFDDMKPPASFLQAMEEYVRDAPRGSTFRKDQV